MTSDRASPHLEARVEGSRRGDVQGLRAVAVALVVIYHAGLGLPGGFVGVDVFFVISGFVITRMLMTELGQSDHLDLKRFYLRRVRRLLPALGLMLSVVLLASVLLAPIGGQEITARTGAAAALLNANTYLIRSGGGGYFDVGADVNALLHTWSLSVEEQFYLLFPALVLGAWMLGRVLPRIGSIRAVAVTLALISTLSFVLAWSTTYGGAGLLPASDLYEEISFYSAPTRAWEFAVGGLLALAVRRLYSVPSRVGSCLVVAGAVLILAAAIGFDAQTRFPGVAALVPVIGALMILAAGEGRAGNPLSRGLAVRPAQLLGDLSYSWYLWHWPLIVFATALWPSGPRIAVIGAAVSLVPAWLSYRFVESPIRFASRRPARRTLVLASVCIVVPLGPAVVLDGAHSAIVGYDDTLDSAGLSEVHADRLNGCDSSVPLGARPGGECTWSRSSPVGLAVLVGDSNAGHFTEAFTGAANAERMDATVATMSACPFVDLITFNSGSRMDDCRAFVTQTLQALIELQPDIVVIASSSDQYIEGGHWFLQVPGSEAQATTSEEKAEVWAGGLSRVIEPLQAAGIEVAIAHPVPKFPGWDPRECVAIKALLDPESCGSTQSRGQADLRIAAAIAAESKAASTTSTPTLDLANELCPEAWCSTHRDGLWIWADGNHITVDESVLLVPDFRRLLRELAPIGLLPES